MYSAPAAGRKRTLGYRKESAAYADRKGTAGEAMKKTTVVDGQEIRGIPVEGTRPVSNCYTDGLPAQGRLSDKITNKTDDGIYVIDKGSCEVLYANASRRFLSSGQGCIGKKCYAALFGQKAPCRHCTLNTHGADGMAHEMVIEGSDRCFVTWFQETDWNGTPAYIKYIRDVTEEVHNRREKERLAMYFRTVLESLPGGISVIRCGQDGSMKTEYISDGFAAMTHMTVEEAMKLYETDIFAGLHPEDAAAGRQKLAEYVEHGAGHCELTARMKLGGGGYIWVKDTVSLQKAPEGGCRLYSVYTDIAGTVEEKEQMNRQYEDIILQHYRTPGPDTLVLGHCNITQDKILEIWDATDSGLLTAYGDIREDFFLGLSGLVVEEEERKAFRDTYLNVPALAAFRRHDMKREMQCYVKLPREDHGRYVKIRMELVEMPDTGDVIGVLTVTDITENTIADRILHQLSVTSHDYVVDLDLGKDSYRVLSCSQNAHCIPPPCGCHSAYIAAMAGKTVVPRDRGNYEKALEPEEIRRRLSDNGPYTFTYSIIDEKGGIRTKNMTVSITDLRLDRVCLICTDITESVVEQQGLLNMLAYTFEQMGFLDIGSESFTMYSRRMVLENLPPYFEASYGDYVTHFTEECVPGEKLERVREQFSLKIMLARLDKEPAGYDFVFQCQRKVSGPGKFPCKAEDGVHYKQVNVLWGDENHRTICMVHADVTDILTAEQQAQKELEEALALAEEANQTKSNFLSSMSHDIRTPMNAIVNMTALGLHYIDDKERVEGCLKKIEISSQHLLSLVNDVLDMSRIERSGVVMNPAVLHLPALLKQISVIMEPRARAGGLRFKVQEENIKHPFFYGDALHIKRILINLLSNAVKFTPEGGEVLLLAEEIPAVQAEDRIRYRFSVRDTGIGMREEFLAQVFDPFARDNSAAQIEGTGLGLSIARGLVELMDGRITVESKLKEGSVFRVELEFDKAQESSAARTELNGMLPAAQLHRKLLEGRRFLVAEDNQINAEIIRELLAVYGAGCEVEPDGAQAVRAFLEKEPGTYDAILMDIQMPVMNGYEAAGAIRALSRPDAEKIPIIAITANAFSEDVQKALEAGMNTHVAKPIDMNLLGDALRMVLDNGHTP